MSRRDNTSDPFRSGRSWLERRLLWIDGLAGTTAGVVMLSLGGWLSSWYLLPRPFLTLLGVANLAYASYSLSLASRSVRSRRSVVFLAVANLLWALACLRWAVVYFAEASAFGLAHLLLEALFVGALSQLEWRWRERLLVDTSPRASSGASRG